MSNCYEEVEPEVPTYQVEGVPSDAVKAVILLPPVLLEMNVVCKEDLPDYN